jgi:lipoate-protein ligase A
VLCFLHHTPGDLLVAGHKVAGSAQRKQRGALLQHGAILLAASPSTPVLPGIGELTGQRLTVAETCASVRHAFAQQTGWHLAEAEWTVAERQRLHELVAGKYTQESWNRRR